MALKRSFGVAHPIANTPIGDDDDVKVKVKNVKG